jgi:phosphatidylglycerol:prolipoprotein diacylglycerol transferase
MSKIWSSLWVVLLVVVVAVVLVPIFAGHVILPQGFNIGPLEIRFYGLTMALAVLVGFFMVRANAWRFGLSNEEATRAVFWAIICSIIGARLYFVAFDWAEFASNPIAALKIWQGGLSLYGGLAAGILFVLFWTQKKLYNSAQLFDLAALALPVSHAVGRLGNLFNYEAYGPATDLPWKMYVPAQFRIDLQSDYFHPLFLYEALGNLMIFLLLLSLRGRVKSGGLAVIYLGLYGILRFMLEFWRTDSTWVAGIRLDQWVSIALVAVAIILGWKLSHNSPTVSSK